MLLNKIKFILLPYITGKSYYSINKNCDKEYTYPLLGHSHLISKNKLNFLDGIPLGIYNGRFNDQPLCRRVHVSGLSEVILGYFELGMPEKTIPIVQFIEKNITTLDYNGSKISFWKTYPHIKSNAYFVHGMGQGELISALIRYQHYTKSSEIEILIHQIANSFLVPYTEIFGFVKIEERDVYIEEYPHPEKFPQNMETVLNGWIFGLIGLIEYQKYFESKKLNNLIQSSISTLNSKIHLYDKGVWSSYNIKAKPLEHSSIHYHSLHAKLLYIIGKKEELNLLLEYSKKFTQQLANPLTRVFSLICKLISNIIYHRRLFKS